MTIRAGLVSVTLRHLSPERVVAAAAEAGLTAVEWGGDVHVPHGDLAAAERVAALTARAGLAVSAYGSYYRLGHPDSPTPSSSRPTLPAPSGAAAPSGRAGVAGSAGAAGSFGSSGAACSSDYSGPSVAAGPSGPSGTAGASGPPGAAGAAGSSGAVGSSDAEAVIATAARLGAPVIRVWAGRRASADADATYRARVRDDALRLAAMAGDIGIVLEYHRETLTDTRASTASLLDELRGAGIRTLWQPQPERPVSENAGDLRELLPDLANLHVFAWAADRSRLPLADHRARWEVWLGVAAEAAGDRYASLEFVAGDDPTQVLLDAATLHSLL